MRDRNERRSAYLYRLIIFGLSLKVTPLFLLLGTEEDSPLVPAGLAPDWPVAPLFFFMIDFF